MHSVVATVTTERTAAQKVGVAASFQVSTLNAPNVPTPMTSVAVDLAITDPLAASLASSAPLIRSTTLAVSKMEPAPTSFTALAEVEISMGTPAAQPAPNARPRVHTTACASLVNPRPMVSVVVWTGREHLAVPPASNAIRRTSTIRNVSLRHLPRWCEGQLQS